MKQNSNNSNIEPPKFLFDFWTKGLIRTDNIIKINKRLKIS